MQLPDEAALKKLIAQGESSTLELKIAVPRPIELAERLCGMANGAGGLLIIGVEDGSNAIAGVKEPLSKSIDGILRAARLCTPPVTLSPSEPKIYRYPEGVVLVAGVPPSGDELHQAGGTFWIRRGTNTIPLTKAELLEMLYDRGSLTWEEQPVQQATLDDLDLKRFELFLESRDNYRYVRDQNLLKTPDILKRLGCAVEIYSGNQASLVPTNAGLLMFGRESQAFIRQSEVVCMLFTDEVGAGGFADRKIITGSIPEQIDGVAAS
ncbi:MAG TPA: RNA-binding domain-containing protein [Chloroflexia bacterium]|nr:RNA-binding domain-containing protein [Chloroflexia bacterium]